MAMPYRSAPGWVQAADAMPSDAGVGLAMGTRPLLFAAAAATGLLVVVPRPARSDAALALHDSGLTQLAQERIYQNLDWVASRLGAGGDLSGLVWACKVLTVYVACFGLLRIVARLAATETAGWAAGALLIGLTYLTCGTGFVAGGAFIGGDFTAAQIGVALAILAVALALDGSLAAAVALLGLACDANVGVGVWGAFALAGASVAMMRDGNRIGRAWLLGGLCALVLAAPAVLSLLPQFAGGSGPPTAEAAIETLLQAHRWALWLVPLQDWVLFGSALVLGMAACSTLGADARAASGAFLGVLLVFVLGCVLPFVTANPALLGLRLMAADGLLQGLAAAAATAVLVRDVKNGRGLLRVALSAAVGACLLLHPYLLPFAALAMLGRAAAAHGELLGVERRIRDWNRAALSRMAISAVVIAALGAVVLRSGWLLK